MRTGYSAAATIRSPNKPRSPMTLGEQDEACLHLAAQVDPMRRLLDGTQRARHPVGETVFDGAALADTGLRRVVATTPRPTAPFCWRRRGSRPARRSGWALVNTASTPVTARQPARIRRRGGHRGCVHRMRRLTLPPPGRGGRRRAAPFAPRRARTPGRPPGWRLCGRR